LLIILLISGGCTGAPKSKKTSSQLPSVTQTPHPQYSTIDITSVAGIADTPLKDFFPETLTVAIFGQNRTLVPVRANPNSLENEFPILVQAGQQNPAIVGETINGIKLKDAYVYMETTSPSNIWIEYSIYEFTDPQIAKQAIDLYSMVWNTIKFEVGNDSLWVWEGWKEQVATGRIPDRYRSGAFCSWDPNKRVMIFSDQGLTPQVLTSPQTDLFCLHAEQARGPYFFMIDLHASPAIIEDVAKEAFSQIVPYIYNVSINITSQIPAQVPGDNLSVNGTGNVTISALSPDQEEIQDLENQIIELTRKFTQNEISYEEFSRIFEIYDRRIKELKGE